MFFPALLTLAQESRTASEFFPLTVGLKRTYEDTGAPGTQYVEVVGRPFSDTDSKGPDGKPVANEYPVDTYIDGQKISTLTYQILGNKVGMVGRGQYKPMDPRVILIVQKGAKWDYFGDTVNVLTADRVHVECSVDWGPDTSYFGKLRQTVVLNMTTTINGSSGLKLTEKAIYASGIGLVEYDESGVIGKNKVDHSKKIVAFSPGAGA